MVKDYDWLEEWYKSLLYAGVSFNEIHNLDVYEANLILQNHKEKEKEKIKNIMTLAYNTGAFVSAMSYGKSKLPPLEKYLDNIEKAYLSGNKIDNNEFEKKKEQFHLLQQKFNRKEVKDG